MQYNRWCLLERVYGEFWYGLRSLGDRAKFWWDHLHGIKSYRSVWEIFNGEEVPF